MFGVVGDGRDVDSEFFEGGDVSCWRGRSAEDEEVVVGGADELRGERDAEVGVEDDAEERAAAGLTVGAEDAAAVGEGGVVGEGGTDAGEDSVGVVAEALDFVAGLRAGEPVGLIGRAGGEGRGELAVY